MQTLSFNSPKILFEERKRLLAVTSFTATNSIFNTTDEKRFSFTKPEYWFSRGGEDTINKMQKVLELRHQNDLALHVEEFEERTLIIINAFSLAYVVTEKNEIIDDLNLKKCISLEVMLFRMEFVNSEIECILDMNYIAISSIGYTLPRGKNETRDFNWGF